MKYLGYILLLAGLGAYAFDSDAWFEKRCILDREAERLQVVYTNCVASLQEPAENLTVPIESWDDGSIKSSVHARKAQFFLDTGMIWAEGVEIEQYAVDGKVEARAVADNCVVDRNVKAVWIEGHAIVYWRKTVLEGDGIYFSLPEEFVRITTNTVIRSEDMKVEGVKL